MRLSVSPRLGVSRQRSFTAENILNRAAFQSQHRSMKAASKELNEASPPTSFQGADCSSTSFDYSEGLEAGMRGTMDISPRFISSSASSSSSARFPMWPTAEPEHHADVTTDRGEEGAARGKNGSGTETFESDNLDENTCANTVKNSNIAGNLAGISGGTKHMNRSSSSGHSPLGDDRRAPKGRMERAYSDIFFQMAAPEHVADVKKDEIGVDHSHHTIGNKTKYTLYDPANQKKKSRKHLNTICEEVCTKMGKKALSVLRCFFYGLYEILVLGPGVGKEAEEGIYIFIILLLLFLYISTVFYCTV
jgi:hypothetical protein